MDILGRYNTPILHPGLWCSTRDFALDWGYGSNCFSSLHPGTAVKFYAYSCVIITLYYIIVINPYSSCRWGDWEDQA